MHPSELQGVLTFLRAAEQLKNTRRTSFTSAGQPESVAQHTWRLSLMALLFAPRYPDLDIARLVKMCIIHDLGEAIGGDVPAIEQAPDAPKAAKERADLAELLRPLPARLRDEIAALWDEYEAAASPEARLAKALDKLETIMQHNQGSNPANFDYRFNLDYGKRYTEGDPLIEAVREHLDRETARRAREAEERGLEGALDGNAPALYDRVNLGEKLDTFSDHWQPRTIAQFDGHDVMIAKARGRFVWHSHEESDDFFLVLKGRLTIEMRDRSVSLGPGELFVVPRGVEHRPVADGEAHVLIIEPSGTPNTGDPATAAPRRVL